MNELQPYQAFILTDGNEGCNNVRELKISEATVGRYWGISKVRFVPAAASAADIPFLISFQCPAGNCTAQDYLDTVLFGDGMNL
jgi:hypothetical protein